MEDDQELALTQMRKSVQTLGASTQNFSDPTLLRFLVARSMDPEKAAKMFAQWQKWRVNMVPNGFISESEITEELEARKIYLQVSSRTGRPPLMVIKACKHFPSKDQLQFKKFVVYVLDKSIASSFKGRERGDEKLLIVLDLQSISYKNVDASGLITGFQFLQHTIDNKAILTAYKAYYPERLAKLFILSMPRFFVTVWKLVSRFIEKATLDKVMIVSNDDERRDFVKEIGEEEVPEEYGGRARLLPIQDVVVSPPLAG